MTKADTLKYGLVEMVLDQKLHGKLEPAHDHEGHHYRFVESGIIVDSVTTKMILSKPHLAKWSARLAAEFVLQHREDIEKLGEQEIIKLASLAHEDNRDSAGDIGTRAHNIIEKYVNDWCATKEKPLNILKYKDPFDVPEVMSASRAAQRFFQDKKVTPLASELLVGDERMGVAGTLDLLAVKDGKLQLIDWKTSNAISEDYAIQIAVYGELFKRMTGLKIDKYYIVKLSKKDGTYELHEVNEPRRALAAGKGIFKTYDWFKNGKEKITRIRTWN